MSFFREDGERRQLSWEQLRANVAATAGALRASGVTAGDRVAAWMPNVPETVVMMLATTAIGAVFSSTSADFGVAGVVDRFGQIEPTVLLAADGYTYGGRRFDCLEPAGRDPRRPARRCATRWWSATWSTTRTSRASPAPASFADYTAEHGDADLAFERVPVRPARLHPLLVGHHGRPQVHRPPRRRRPADAREGAPAPLRRAARRPRLLLHDVRLDDVELADVGAGVEGRRSCSTTATRSFPGPAVLFDLADRYDVTLFGTSAKFIDAGRKAGLAPRSSHRLARVRTITSTGSPLARRGIRVRLRAT